MKISIFGTGYVGLVTGAGFAEVGNHVTCVDIDQDRVNRLQHGECPIYEQGLDEMLPRLQNKGLINFTTNAKEAVRTGDVLFIAVGTPPEEDGSADLQYVLTVAKTIASCMDDYKIIVTKSTVPVGTAEKVRDIMKATLQEKGLAIDFDVVSNPEFLKEGKAIADFMKPDRIIVGADTDKAVTVMRQVYLPFSRNHEKLIIMDLRSAELTKYVSNAILATKISFMNEISQLSERLDTDIEKVRRGIGADERIGNAFIYAGCGYGGSCFPKDVKALRHIASAHAYDAEILHAVENVNTSQKAVLFNKAFNYFNGDLAGKQFAIWGLAFKPGTDDIREAPSRVLIELLWQHGATVKLYDPVAMDNFRETYPEEAGKYRLCNNAYDALEGSRALFIVTEWLEFRSPDFRTIARLLNGGPVIDGRNLYDKTMLSKHNIPYLAIGR